MNLKLKTQNVKLQKRSESVQLFTPRSFDKFSLQAAAAYYDLGLAAWG